MAEQIPQISPRCESCPFAPELEEQLPRPSRTPECPGPTFVLGATALTKLPGHDPAPEITAMLMADHPESVGPLATIRVAASRDEEPLRICGLKYVEPEQDRAFRRVYTNRGVNGLARFALDFENNSATVVGRLGEPRRRLLAEAAVQSYWARALRLYEPPLNLGQLRDEKLVFADDDMWHELRAIASDELTENNLRISEQAITAAAGLLDETLRGSRSDLVKAIPEHIATIQEKIKVALARNAQVRSCVETYLAPFEPSDGGGAHRYRQFVLQTEMITKEHPLASGTDARTVHALKGQLRLAQEILASGNLGYATHVASIKNILLRQILEGSIRPEAQDARDAARGVVDALVSSNSTMHNVLYSLETFESSI